MTTRTLPDVVPGSFRDPAGFLFRKSGSLYRQVNNSYRENYDSLMESGLYDTLTRGSWMVAHEEAKTSLAPRPDAYKVIEPELIPFISYPYEWCFSQLRDAALLTLKIQTVALDHGMSLRDASAYNIQFRGAQPIFIDTLSFEVLREGAPWVAYRQFCQHFLAPLALMSFVDVRLGRLLRSSLDGIDLDLTSALLPRSSKLRPALLLHIVQHAKSQRRHQSGGGEAAAKKTRAFSANAMKGLIDNLKSGIEHLDPPSGPSVWADYYQQDSYTPGAFDHKKTLVREFLAAAKPQKVWDLGGNTGEFSRLAVEEGAHTVSFEMDPAAVEANYHQAAKDGETQLLPLVLDLTDPSPAIGWALQERDSFASRGPADLALALALIHHLAISNNVPLPAVARFFSEITDWLIIEFVPKEDPKVRLLLSSREDIFEDYHLKGFEEAFKEFFVVKRKESVEDSARTLFLMRAR